MVCLAIKCMKLCKSLSSNMSQYWMRVLPHLSCCFLTFLRRTKWQLLKAKRVAHPDDHISYLSPVSTGYSITLVNFVAHWCILDGSILSYFPVIILNFSSFAPYYPNLATLTYFPAACIPQTPREQAVALAHIHLKRIIYIAQVWDQSNLCGTIEYTNLRSDVSVAEGRQTVSAAERDRE